MWHELPHEYRCDQFGIYLTEKLWPREKLNREIEILLNRPECIDRERLQIMLSLVPRDNLDKLRDEIVEFSKPYKEGLIASWNMDKQKRGNDSLASLIENCEKMFE
jgi:hypothetical protein